MGGHSRHFLEPVLPKLGQFGTFLPSAREKIYMIQKLLLFSSCTRNYTLTSHSTCTRIPCYLNDRHCKSLAHTISYNYMSLPANVYVPVDVFKLTAQLQQPNNKLQFMIYSDPQDEHSGRLNFAKVPLEDYRLWVCAL